MDAFAWPNALRMSTSKRDGTVTVTVGGELDLATAGQLRAYAKDVMGGGALRLVLVMSEVSFINATGLGALVAIAAQAARKHTEFRLGEVSPVVERLLTITGLDRAFPTAPPLAPVVSPDPRRGLMAGQGRPIT